MGHNQSHSSNSSRQLIPFVTDKPPYIEESEVFHEGVPESCELFKSCAKNPEHLNFIPANEFKMSHLPPEYRTEKRLKHIKDFCDRTVRAVVKYTSPNRPDTFPNSTAPYPFSRWKGSSRKTRLGTGYISSGFLPGGPGQTCPCHHCRDSNNPHLEHCFTTVTTAAHLVFDKSEAMHTVFELFYDSEERDNVKYLYGFDIFDDRNDRERCDQDYITVLCATHDLQVRELVFVEMPSYNDRPVADESFGIIISHPHGGTKHITSGTFLRREAPVPAFDFTQPVRKKAQSWFKRKFDKSSCSNYQSEFLVTISRMPLTSPDPPRELFSRLKSSKCNWAGPDKKVFEPKKNTKLSLPKNIPYLCWNDFLESRWYKFYPGTSIFRGQSDEWLIPPEMEFDSPSRKTRKIYNISTCPGCSGAPVIRYINGLHSDFIMTHAGALGDGTNRSVLEYLW